MVVRRKVSLLASKRSPSCPSVRARAPTHAHGRREAALQRARSRRAGRDGRVEVRNARLEAGDLGD